MKLLTMKNVRKTFGELEVLRDISLSVGEGEIVSIIGPSGSGKSTLLRCATLLERMDSGSLRYEDTVVCENDAAGNAIYRDKKRSGRYARFTDWFSRIFISSRIGRCFAM